MNSGKSTALMQVAYNYEERGMRVLIMKPSIDTKGGEKLMSRLGVERRVDIAVRPDMDPLALVRADIAKNGPLACVLTDESQFFTSWQAEQLFMVTVALNVPVICYGLRADFSLQGFPGSTRLLELAHNIEEMKPICQCGRKALFNGRKVNGNLCLKAHRWPLTWKTMCSTNRCVPSAISANGTSFLQKRRRRRHRNPAQTRRDAHFLRRFKPESPLRVQA